MILIFGGNGQLGRELVRLGESTGVALVAVARAAADIADPAAVHAQLERCKPTLVVNAAAYTGVDAAESDPEAAARCNARGAAVIASVCTEVGIPLIHISSDYVFDGRKENAYVETDTVAPLGAYGRSKADGEAAVMNEAGRSVILRTAWLYGEFGSNFLKTILRLAQERDDLSVVSDQKGSPTSTRNLAEAILHIAPRVVADNGVAGLYHFAGSGVTTWHGLASRIVAAQGPLTNRWPKVIPISSADYPTVARRPRNSVLDCAKFAGVFGLEARPWDQEADVIAKAAVVAMQQIERANVA